MYFFNQQRSELRSVLLSQASFGTLCLSPTRSARSLSCFTLRLKPRKTGTFPPSGGQQIASENNTLISRHRKKTSRMECLFLKPATSYFPRQRSALCASLLRSLRSLRCRILHCSSSYVKYAPAPPSGGQQIASESNTLISRHRKKTSRMECLFSKTSNVLLSQAAARQVSSALKSLTSVFEMGTGVSSSL